MFLETRACGPRYLKVILESTRSLGEYLKESNFNISSYNHHKYWNKIFRNIYWVLQAIYLGFSGLIWRTAPFSRLLWHTWGCGGSILTRVLSGYLMIWNKAQYSGESLMLMGSAGHPFPRIYSPQTCFYCFSIFINYDLISFFIFNSWNYMPTNH
jgi:hypothetical protein